MVLQKFFEGKQAIFTNKKPELPITARLLMPGSQERLLKDAEIEAAVWMSSGLCVIPKAFLRDQLRTNDARTVHHGVIAVSFLVDVNRRRQLVHFISRGLEKRNGIVGPRFPESNCGAAQDWRSDATGFYD